MELFENIQELSGKAIRLKVSKNTSYFYVSCMEHGTIKSSLQLLRIPDKTSGYVKAIPGHPFSRKLTPVPFISSSCSLRQTWGTSVQGWLLLISHILSSLFCECNVFLLV